VENLQVCFVNMHLNTSFRRWFRRSVIFMVLAGGTLFQTSCATTAAEVFSGLSISIINQIIRNYTYDALGISSTMTGF